MSVIWWVFDRQCSGLSADPERQISQTSTQRYRSEILKLLLGQDLHFFDKPENSSGALVSKLTSIPAALQDLMSLTMFLILMLLFNLVASSTLAIAYGWKLGLIIVFTGMPILVGCGYARFRFERDLEKKNSEKFAASAALAHEAVTNIRTVASMTMETQVLDAYGAMLDDIAKLTIRSSAWTIFGLALSQSLELLLLALGFWYGAGLLASGEYDVTQFFVCFLAVFFGGQAAGQIFGYSMTLTAARSAVNYILKLRSLEPGVKDDITHAQDGPGDDCVISAEEVNFTYDQRRSVRVLKDFNIEVSPNQSRMVHGKLMFHVDTTGKPHCLRRAVGLREEHARVPSRASVRSHDGSHQIERPQCQKPVAATLSSDNVSRATGADAPGRFGTAKYLSRPGNRPSG